MLQRVIPDAQVLSVGGPYGIDADLGPEVWLGNSEEEASEDLLATETCPPTESRSCALPGAAEEEVSGEGAEKDKDGILISIENDEQTFLRDDL